MKQIKFDERFKEAILNKEKVATIRNNKKVDIGEIFEMVVDGQIVGKAKIISVYEIDRSILLKKIISSINCKHETVDFIVGQYLLTTMNYNCLGFGKWSEAFETYKIYLKNEHCYLHIFELLED